jgi:hypothetical protein
MVYNIFRWALVNGSKVPGKIARLMDLGFILIEFCGLGSNPNYFGLIIYKWNRVKLNK